MLGFFRRVINSKVGIVVTFIVLGVIALAFAAGDVTGLRSGGIAGASVARVGGTTVSDQELTKRVQDELRGIQQNNPGVDMAQFIQAGGVEGTLQRIVSGLALDEFGRQQGMLVSRALVGSELQQMPGLQGPTGKFDQNIYEQILARNRLTDAQVQGDIARDTMAKFLLTPQTGARQVPQSLALPYASLLLEKRAGQVAFVPAAAVPAGSAPTDQDLQTWYQRNVARYTVPERRVVRYARISPDELKAQAVPTDADLRQAYQANAARFAAKQTRSVSLVTVLDQNAANALAGKVKSGTALAAAARASGLEPRTIANSEKDALARQTSAAVADALFAAPDGGVVGPVRGAIGFVVAKVDGVQQIAAKSFDQARGELLPELTQKKLAETIAAKQDAITNAINDNATFAEIVADQKLAAQTTAALTAGGADPEKPEAKPDPALVPILAAGFQAEEGDDPQIVGLTPDGSFAVVALDRIVRAAPRPLVQVRDAVAKDVAADRARRAARQVATAVLGKVNKGVAIEKALAESGVKAPPVQRLAAARAQLNADPRGVDPTLALMFSMAGGTAKLLEAPNNAGWLIVKLEQITPGDAGKVPGAINATRGDLGRVIGNEYAQQFTEAVKAALKVATKPEELTKVKASLTGGGNQ